MTEGHTGMQWFVCYGCDKTKNIPCMLMLPMNTFGPYSANEFYIMQLKDKYNGGLRCPHKLTTVNYQPVTFQQIVETILHAKDVAKMDFVENKSDAKLMEDINNRFRNIEIV